MRVFFVSKPQKLEEWSRFTILPRHVEGASFVCDTMISDPQASDLGDKVILLFKSPRLWYFIMASTAN